MAECQVELDSGKDLNKGKGCKQTGTSKTGYSGQFPLCGHNCKTRPQNDQCPLSGYMSTQPPPCRHVSLFIIIMVHDCIGFQKSHGDIFFFRLFDIIKLK